MGSTTVSSNYYLDKRFWENDSTKKTNFWENLKTDTLKLFSRIDFFKFDLESIFSKPKEENGYSKNNLFSFSVDKFYTPKAQNEYSVDNLMKFDPLSNIERMQNYFENGYAKVKTTREEIDNLIEKYSEINGLDPLLVSCIIKQESAFNNNIVSNKGAMGLMQLMPETAQKYNVENPFDPEQNIQAGTKFFASLVKQFNGNINLALAAYNAGPHREALKKGKIPNIPETKDFVKRITTNYENLKAQNTPKEEELPKTEENEKPNIKLPTRQEITDSITPKLRKTAEV